MIKMNYKSIKEYIKFGLTIALIYIFFSVLGIGCPIKFVTGISCPGCGMTRAWISLFNMDIQGAFYYHPLFFLPTIYLLLFVFKNKISYKIFICLITLGIFSFLTTYILRILNPRDIVVDINIDNGFVYSLLKKIAK